MGLTFGFYNSLDGDRKYDAIQLSSMFDGLIADGVFATIGDALTVTPGTGLQVLVGIGRAWFNHTWTNNDAALPLAVSLPHVILNRIDSVILEVDATDGVRTNSIKILEGTAGSNPVEPVLTETSTVHQHRLANILVKVGATGFVSGDITNKIGLTGCPFVTGVIDTIDASALVAQWNSEFGVWFDEMKDQLSTDAAGNLQAQIDALPTKTTGAEVATGTDDFKYITPKAIKDSHNVPNAVPSTAGNLLQSDGTDWLSGAPVLQKFAMDGRLTLVSGTPITVVDASGTTLYLTPFRGNRIHLWDGAVWRNRVLTEISVVIPARAPSRTGHKTQTSAVISSLADTSDLSTGWNASMPGFSGTIQSKTSNSITLNQVNDTGTGDGTVSFLYTGLNNWDVFCYDVAGTPTLELRPWTSDTARNGALGYQDGVLVLGSDHTRRYIGTVRTSGSTFSDLETDRLVWNYYNRVPRLLRNVNSNAHSYTSAAWRLFNNSAAGHQVTMVIGVEEEPVYASGLASWAASASTIIANFALGIDSSTVPSDAVRIGGWINTQYNIHTPYEPYMIEAGYRVINLLENWISGATVAWSAGGVVGQIRG